MPGSRRKVGKEVLIETLAANKMNCGLRAPRMERAANNAKC
jgi:hypothetical protein